MTIPTDRFVHIARNPAETRPLPDEEAPPARGAAPTTTRLPALTWREELALAWRIWSDRAVRSWPALALAAVLALALAAALLRPAAGGAEVRTAPMAPTPPIVLPTAPVEPAGPVLPVALVAYEEPGGRQLGELAAGRAYTVLAQAHGGAWLQIDAGSGPVWVEVSSWGQAAVVRPAALADLTPPTPVPTPEPPAPPQIVYVAAPPQPQRQAAPAPQVVASTVVVPADLVPVEEAPGWHPPFASGHNPAGGAGNDCPLVLSPAELEQCLAGQP